MIMRTTKCGFRLSSEKPVFATYVFIFLIGINSASITSDKYREVAKTIEQNHAGSVLITSSMRTKFRCANLCDTSQCLSFSYNSLTQECKTFSVEICYRNDGVTSSTLKFYTKDVQFVSPSTCGDVPTVHCSGVYTLTPSTGNNVDAYCDMDTAGGPWTIFANRYDGSVDFYKTWNEYKNGFGSLTGEFWLGFENVRLLLAQNMKLRVEMTGWTSPLKYVEYNTFDISDEASDYRLTLSAYTSLDGLFNALADHNGNRFSTLDNDNDAYSGQCSSMTHGAWWYTNCIDSNLFGNFSSDDIYTSMIWKYFYSAGTEYTAVKTVRMMLKKK